MKKFIGLLLMSFLLVPATAMAAEETTVVTYTYTDEETVSDDTYTEVEEETAVLPDAGITPDSIFYVFDQFAESIRTSLTFDPVKEAEYLDSIAAERLSESDEMLKQAKVDLAQITLNEYEKVIAEVKVKLEQAIADGQDVSGVLEKLIAGLEDREDFVDSVIDQLPEDVKEEFETKLDAASDQIALIEELEDVIDDTEINEEIEEEKNPLKEEITKTVLAETVNDSAFMDKAAELNLDARQILAVKSLADQSGKTLDEVLTIFIENGMGIGATVKALGMEPKDAMKGVNETFKETKKLINENFKDAKKNEDKKEDEEKNKDDEDLDEEKDEEDSKDDEDLDEEKDEEKNKDDEDLDEEKDEEKNKDNENIDEEKDEEDDKDDKEDKDDKDVDEGKADEKGSKRN